MMMLSFARFDLRSWLPRTQTLLPLVLVAVAGVAVPVSGMSIVAAALVTSLLASVPFLTDERARLDTLYGVLPVSRATVVAGRALAIVAYGALAMAVGVVATLVVPLVRGTQLDAAWVVTFVGLAAGFVGVSLCIQLPVLFAVGYSRGRLVAYAPAFVVAGLAWIAQALGLTGGVASAPQPVPILLGGLALGALGIVVGAVLATRAYRAREIR
ncbi:ABC-2 transporter permease [Agrococcus jejuensis]|uniref:ABC-2 family transporter protein n=1 Tax=Agrococcus jejuensis TaxID=399736 RepID=A0A1G8H3F6_9MICO|nr:ABC-2 transporter permease [Agrococcus jejuensis]SDI01156.1 ABC-2 family transporter protein [Agrococcus jejuensis]